MPLPSRIWPRKIVSATAPKPAREARALPQSPLSQSILPHATTSAYFVAPNLPRSLERRMEIWVHRNGQFAGRFSESIIRTKIADGSFSPTDLAWDEAKSSWKPISEFLASVSAATSVSTHRARRQSRRSVGVSTASRLPSSSRRRASWPCDRLRSRKRRLRPPICSTMRLAYREAPSK